MRINRWLVALIPFLLAGCGASSPESPSAVPGTAPASLNVTGLVRDALSRPVDGARVEVDEAPGRVASTDVNGRFSLADVPSPRGFVTIHLTKDGYEPAAINVRRSQEVFVSLTPTVFADLEGPFTITFIADASCAQIPASLRTRTYSAVISRPDPKKYGAPTFTAVLGSADFAQGYGTMFGRLDRVDARFSVWSWDAYNSWLEELPIIERVTATSHLSLGGSVIGPVQGTKTAFSEAFEGTFSYCNASIPPSATGYPLTCASTALISCASSQHRITVNRF